MAGHFDPAGRLNRGTCCRTERNDFSLERGVASPPLPALAGRSGDLDRGRAAASAVPASSAKPRGAAGAACCWSSGTSPGGTSSRSSKMVHGGLRYIAKGQWRLTRDSVRERQRLLGEAPGLVEPLELRDGPLPRRLSRPAAIRRPAERLRRPCRARNHRFYDAPRCATWRRAWKEQRRARRHAILRCGDRRCAPGAAGAGRGASRRRRGIQRHACARIAARGRPGGRPARRGPRERRAFRLSLPRLALATGAWADELRQPGGSEHIRPLRGSHLLLPAWRLPVAHAFSFMHATDRRPVFVFPWEGATVVGTTDLDHRDGLGEDARISRANSTTCWRPAPAVPPPAIEARDVLSTWAGVRTGGQQPATTAASLPTRNASMCSGASRAA